MPDAAASMRGGLISGAAPLAELLCLVDMTDQDG